MAAVDRSTGIVVRNLTAAQLPAGLPAMAGKLVEAKTWQDRSGENLLLVSRTPELPEPDGPDEAEGARRVELYARQYVRRAGAGYELLWKLQDNVGHCPVDIVLGIIPGSTAITDLDKDGQTETMLVYQQACRGDVSADGLKLIMHEGQAKYALRGNNVTQYDSLPSSQRAPKNLCCLDTVNEARAEAAGDYRIYEGRYQNEKEFVQAPPAFLAFARQQWRHWSVQPTHDPE
nr:hypothetical protein [Hymenobacter chitinivorans]